MLRCRPDSPMHVIVYTSTRHAALADARAAELLADGYSVAFRAGRHFTTVEPCDLCVCDWDAGRAAEAYRAAGIAVEIIRAPVMVTAPADIPAPARRKRRSTR